MGLKSGCRRDSQWTLPRSGQCLFEGDLQTEIQKITQNGLAYVPLYSKDARPQTPEIRWVVLGTEWEMSIESMRPGDLIALDYDWSIEDLQIVKQISHRVHEGGGKFGIRLPIAEIHTSILDRPEWKLAPVPVVQWQAMRKSHNVDGEAEQDEEETQQSTTHEVAPVVYCVLSDYGYYLTQAVKNADRRNSSGPTHLGPPDFRFTKQPLKRLRCAGASALYTRRIDRRDLSMAF